ncbi:hypothetical protein HMPREF6485_0291 [Segatella buccae ATCC 33574]|uniref:Uncharacterized protein n=1 Tax=Segatella buccae ATCC 33574 TaxID=873513 RepID=E6K3G5_9BACT|nr:hypothetical protein HMPREF6485_0291 [Segatella buccae ATCC 33574]
MRRQRCEGSGSLLGGNHPKIILKGSGGIKKMVEILAVCQIKCNFAAANCGVIPRTLCVTFNI